MPPGLISSSRDISGCTELLTAPSDCVLCVVICMLWGRVTAESSFWLTRSRQAVSDGCVMDEETARMLVMGEWVKRQD